MTKVNTPLLSLGAHGTIADSITFQSHIGIPYARRVPKPTNPKTLSQRYHRWDYLHYIYMWSLLTASQKEAWSVDPDKGRMTGFNFWQKTKLLTLPDLILRAYLDDGYGSLARDSSKGNHNGTITGALWTEGKLGKALLFDGIDDRVNFGTSLDLAPKQSFTVEAIIKPHAYGSRYIAGRGWRYPWGISLEPTKLRLDLTRDTGAQYIYRSNSLPPLNQWSYLMVTYDYTNSVVRHKVNGDETTFATLQYNLQQAVGAYTFLGANPIAPTTQPFDGVIDHFSLYSYSMSFAEARDRRERFGT